MQSGVRAMKGLPSRLEIKILKENAPRKSKTKSTRQITENYRSILPIGGDAGSQIQSCDMCDIPIRTNRA